MLRFVSLLILLLVVFGVVEVSAQSYPPLAQELNGSWVPYRKIGDSVFEMKFSWGVGLGNPTFFETFDLEGQLESIKDCQVITNSFPYKLISIVKIGPKSLRVTTEFLSNHEHPLQTSTIYTFLDHERMTIYRKGTDGAAYNGKTVYYRVSGPGEYLGKLVKIYSPIVKLKQ